MREMDAFDHVADVVVVGAGAAGIPAAISARDTGASVVVVEANYDIGGHAILSTAWLQLGGGTSWQKKYGVEDSPDVLYADLVDPHHAQYRRSDRDLARVFADESVATFDFLLENGVVFRDQPPVVMRFGSIARACQTISSTDDWSETINGAEGSGLMRGLEKTARQKGVTFLLRHRLTRVMRESPSSGRVTGIAAETDGREVRIGARRGVILATGGHSSNVGFRRVFDPRLTAEYQTAGEPWTAQNADGEMAAIAVGAALWAVGIQTNDSERNIGGGTTLYRTAFIGCRYGYPGLRWDPRSPVFARAGASGLLVGDPQDVILVNEIGQRFWNELDPSTAFLHACLGPHGRQRRDGRSANGGGPIWAIFDANAVERERWVPEPPNVDPAGWFFSAPTIAELARRIVNPYQRDPIRPDVLEASVERYNEIIDLGEDLDFGRPPPLGGQRISTLRQYKIQVPPFYAAWSTPMVHDSLTGLRIDTRSRVLDWNERVIEGLYCAGESAGGLGLHGLTRAIVFGRIAGADAARAGPST
jgi:urocanate reductase